MLTVPGPWYKSYIFLFIENNFVSRYSFRNSLILKYVVVAILYKFKEKHEGEKNTNISLTFPTSKYLKRNLKPRDRIQKGKLQELNNYNFRVDNKNSEKGSVKIIKNV